jgi:hypothetical protein
VQDHPFEITTQSTRKQIEVTAGPVDRDMPITRPLGASRSCTWQASSTSQASCSWGLIKACSR